MNYLRPIKITIQFISSMILISIFSCSKGTNQDNNLVKIFEEETKKQMDEATIKVNRIIKNESNYESETFKDWGKNYYGNKWDIMYEKGKHDQSLKNLLLKSFDSNIDTTNQQY